MSKTIMTFSLKEENRKKLLKERYETELSLSAIIDNLIEKHIK